MKISPYHFQEQASERTPKKHLLGVMLFSLSLVFGGCFEKVESPDFTFINGPEPETLDPHLITGQPDFRICAALFEGLTRRNARGETIPGVAESWDVSSDGLTYTFHLRSDARWSNGDPVTAQDFVWSWQRALTPELASSYAEMQYSILGAEDFNRGTLEDFSQVGVKAIDEDTLEGTLKHPTPYFIELCCMPIFMPIHKASALEHGDNWIKPGNMVSNGAYTLRGWWLDNRIELEANPEYWDASSVHFKRITSLTTANATTAFNLFYTGKADLILDKGLVPSLFLEELRKKPFFHANPFLATYFYRFNVTRPPFDNAKVRAAFALALDKERIVKRITKAGETIAGAFTPLGIPHYNPPQGLTYNPHKAKELLAEAGYPGGEGFPRVTLLYNSTELNKQIATEIQAMWRDKLGVEVTLRNQEWKTYLNSMEMLDYDIARSSWVGDYNDPNTFLDCFVTRRGNNRTGWSNARYDALMAASQKEGDKGKRARLLYEAEKILIEEELPIVPIYYFVGITLYHSERLGGFYPNVVDDHPLRELYWKHQ